MATSAIAARAPSPVTWMVGLAGLMIFINYVDRGNLATAGPLVKAEMGLSNTAFGLLVSAFFWTYTPAQLLAGHLSQRFSAHLVLAAGLALWAVATILTGFAGGFVSLLLLRLLLGLGESVAFPCSSKLFADHVPAERYGQANAATALGLSIGPAFGIYVGGMVMAAYGWRTSFIGFGLLSLLWLIPWLRLPRNGVAPHASTNRCPPLLSIMRRREAWGAALGHFAVTYSFYFMLAWLPLYLVKAHGFTLVQMATLGGIIYVVQGGSAILFGWLPDRWIAAGATPNRARKTMMAGGCALTSVCMVAAAVGTAPVAIAALLVSGVFSGMTGSNIYATGQTLAGPCAAGKWIGFQNCIGNFAGIVAPAFTGWLVDRTGGFSAAFAVAAAVSLSGVFFWSVMIRRVAPLTW
ncbi:MFS transporter [Sphingomonas tabacisoli]|uniref:MFS transporter n=1 Tax=Sphingomonas tabacisoli TaxID=2249466 RepID=A0ABW4HZL4_9SPHN